ncbi:ImmA/IrrE family metallo-endopeptidase [Mammaliicoccus lentus]|uniref:ImmA/IrrE family metallo-endopeptidase n=1 Tax=Mammaliicoccus lentus TaxID=42858 RepID=UPI001C4F3CEF|nr:ImmA/IrrE family metallo-endopeptidase [Mammaliicoccus lentus]MBW0761381.1 ImmA/IrrE family metallo-endopeptidase [Mammaliicoccus lentus]
MGKLEELLLEYDDKLIIEEGLLPKGLAGLYQDDLIILERRLNSKYKLETLSEELAHFKITYGDIRNQSDMLNKKLEIKARRYGYELLITLDGIISAYKNGVHNLYELANYFEVTESYVIETLNHYKMKFGLSAYHEGYVIKFEPLQVFEYINFN